MLRNRDRINSGSTRQVSTWITNNAYIPVAAGSYGLSFDGTNDYAEASSSTFFDKAYTDDFSISFWYKGTIASNKMVLAKGDNFTNGGITIYNSDSSSNALICFLTDSSSNFAVRRSDGTQVFNDGEWHHIVVTWTGGSVSGSNLHLYVDDVECSYDYTDQSGASIGISNAYKWRVATDASNTSYGEFDIDSLAFYNEVVSSADITALFNSGTGTPTPPATNLSEFFRMNENTGTTTTGDNSEVLTLTNGPTWVATDVDDTN